MAASWPRLNPSLASTAMTAPQADLGRRYRNLVGWTWLTHGILLVVGAPGLLAMTAVVGLIGPDLLEHLPRPERLQLEHLQAALARMAMAWPWMLALGAAILPPAIAFLRRARWARAAIELLSWLHVLVVFPLAGWWLLSLPPLMLRFDHSGEPIELTRMISHLSHALMLVAMEGLAIYLLVLVRRRELRTPTPTADAPA